jgi:anti-anti-sigma factor
LLLTINEVMDGEWVSDGEDQRHSIHTARLAGSIDEHTVAKLGELSDIVFDENRFSAGDHFIIDLREVTEIDSLGLSTMVGIIVTLAAKAGSIGLVLQEDHPVRRALRVTGLDRVFDIHTSTESADKIKLGPP